MFIRSRRKNGVELGKLQQAQVSLQMRDMNIEALQIFRDWVGILTLTLPGSSLKNIQEKEILNIKSKRGQNPRLKTV